MRIAIVHDYLNQYGGAERVLEVVHEIWPQAPIYTSIYDREKMDRWGFARFATPPQISQPQGLTDKTSGVFPLGRGFPSGEAKGSWDIRESFMRRLPFVYRFPKHYFFAYPFAFESFDFSGYDVVLSLSSYAAKGIKVPKDVIHICYCFTPPRFLWGYDTELSHKNFNLFYRGAIKLWRMRLKRWDYNAAQRVDFFVAQSKTVAERIRQDYGRESDAVIYPPVDVGRFVAKPQGSTPPCRGKLTPGVEGEYYLVVSRLGGYKRTDIVVEAFNRLGYPLKIVGIGPELENLRRKAKPNIEFLGRVGDNTVTRLYLGCKALVFPTEEDFGLTPLEAQAAGRPVIAYGKGGALETILEGKTGEFFASQTPEALIKVLKKFDPKKYDPKTCRKQAEKFSKDRFAADLRQFVEESYEKTLRSS